MVITSTVTSWPCLQDDIRNARHEGRQGSGRGRQSDFQPQTQRSAGF
nr:hypothetical protein [Paraburkholderia ribeironis]